MTTLKRWSILKTQAFKDDLFVDEELIRERLGNDYEEFCELNKLMIANLSKLKGAI